MNALFTRLIKNHLVYTVSWEDWELDQSALRLQPDDRAAVPVTGTHGRSDGLVERSVRRGLGAEEFP